MKEIDKMQAVGAGPVARGLAQGTLVARPGSNQELMPPPGTGLGLKKRHAAAIVLCMLLVLIFIDRFAFRDSLFQPSEHIVLSIQGSTTLGDELLPKLARAFLHDEMKAQDTGIRIGPKDARGHSPVYVWGMIPHRSGRQVIEIYPSESSTAFRCLGAENGGPRCDIGMSSRPINSRDENAYPILRNGSGRLAEHVVALDAIAVIVNPRNPVSELSIPQLRGIYSGQIKNWKEVGGLDAPIEFYGRDPDSGTFEMFTEKVFGKDASENSLSPVVPADRQIADSNLIVDAVMRSQNAMGYVSSPMVRSAKAIAISDGSGPPLLPTSLSIVTEDYPICRRLMLYDWDAPGSLRSAFMQYVVYKPGQMLVTQTPFVELTPKVFPAVPAPSAPRAYKEMATKYSRIGLSFHFSTEQIDPSVDANSQLDNLARVNVLRLRTFLSQTSRTGNDILLLGFADNSEVGATVKSRARMRAEVVATSLRAIGVVVPSENIRDFGADVPVASNLSEEGRRKNRRVEVWVRNGIELTPHHGS
jgi:phosphate transport system substrate-binding protein